MRHLGPVNTKRLVENYPTWQRQVPYDEDYQHVNRIAPLDLSQGQITLTSTSGAASAWEATGTYVGVTSGPADVPSLLEFEPYDEDWHTHDHKWPDFYIGANVKHWGADGGIYFRMNTARTSYYLLDQVGLHFVSGGVKTLIEAWGIPVYDDCGMDITMVGDSYSIAVGNFAGTYTYWGSGEAKRGVAANRYEGKHGLLDAADSADRTQFLYLDVNWTGSTAYGLGLKIIEVSDTGEISITTGPELAPEMGIWSGRAPLLMEGPNEGAALLAMSLEGTWATDEDAYTHFWTLAQDGTVEHQQLDVGSKSVYWYATGMSHNEPFLIGTYLSAGYGDLKAIWIAPGAPSAPEPKVAFGRMLDVRGGHSDVAFGRYFSPGAAEG